MDARRPPAPRGAPAAPWVMLLSVWPAADAGAQSGWHARVVLPDASTREFRSPFELAQFVSRAGWTAADASPAAGGLR